MVSEPLAHSVDVRGLRPRDVLEWFPLRAPYLVVSSVLNTRLWGLVTRYTLTLTDRHGTRRAFVLSGDRVFHKITDWTGEPGVWCDDAVQEFTRMAKEDSVVSRILVPISRPLHALLRSLLDLQCLVISIRLRAGFLGILVVLVVFSVTLAAQLAVEYSVAISILGAFAVERCWGYWGPRMRRRLPRGLSMTIRYRPHGLNHRYRYAKLRITKCTAFVGSLAWSSARMELIGRKSMKQWFRLPLVEWIANIRTPSVLATCTVANNIRGDTTFTLRRIAKAIRHRMTDGSRRLISFTSTSYDPATYVVPDLSITPGRNHSVFTMTIRDKDEAGSYSLLLKRYQVRILADTFEVMDDGRQL